MLNTLLPLTCSFLVPTPSLALAAAPLAADPWVVVEELRLQGGDALLLDAVGSSVAVFGDTAVVGAPLGNAPGVADAGAAYVFVRSGTAWAQQAKLWANDAFGGDSFGTSVAISGNTIVVGASLDDDGGNASGSAYVFTRSGTAWTQEAKLVANDASALATFGGAVGVSANTAVVGAYLGSAPIAPLSGTAYVFTRSGTVWTQQAEIFALDAAPLMGFGSSVAISGATIAVGAELADGKGAAYVFIGAQNVWVQQTKLTAADGAAQDQFGDAIAVSGNTAVVGAPQDDDAGSLSGSAYVFTRALTAWSPAGKLVAGDAAAGDQFGDSVAVAGDWILAGAPLDDDGGNAAGSAYLFRRDGAAWSEAKKLAASDAAVLDAFGGGVALAGDLALVGAPAGGPGNTGAAYAFAILGENGGEQCAGPLAIQGPGTFAFDNAGATTDAAPTACGTSGDLWWCWTAGCDATVTVATCGGTSLDTSLAVYDGCACPPSPAALFGCDDDACGAQSSVGFAALQGQTYLIRLASAAPGSSGHGTFAVDVDCSATTPCPILTLAQTAPGAAGFAAARTLRTLYAFRDRVLRASPAGRRWIELYYEHAPAMARILRRDPDLARRAAALVASVAPGLEALAAGDARAAELRVPAHAVALLDALLDGLEHADADGALARTLRAERAVLGLPRLAGASYAAAWDEIEARAGAR